MNRLNHKVALITGAGSGIGEATAKLFAQEGAKVVLVARRESTLQRVKEEIEQKGGTAAYYAASVDDPESGDAVCAFAVRTFGQLDILVNNAGITDQNRSTLHTSHELWDQVVSVNQSGVFYFCRSALRIFEEQGSGVIVNVSSIGGVYGNAGVAYSSTKAAVIGLTKNIALQYAGTGIRCNATCPGRTPTAFNTPEKVREFDRSLQEISWRHVDRSLPMTEQIDQANAILFFACDESSGITGQYLVVDNGMCL